MSELNVKIEEFQIVYKELFSFKSLYKVAHDWLYENSYRDPFNTVEGAFLEQHYIMRENGPVYDMDIVWNAQRTYKNDKFKMLLSVQYILIAGRIDERIIDGKKVVGEAGELNIFLRPSMKVDIGDWEKSLFLNRLKTRVFKDQYKEEIREARDYTYGKTKEFYDYLKTYLDTRAAFMHPGLLLHQPFDDV
ncbi:MAG: hypothetical protein ACMXYL_02395 [Candidatus Woesearchaeota archaeon]